MVSGIMVISLNLPARIRHDEAAREPYTLLPAKAPGDNNRKLRG
jgi:hypothetical protein